MGLGDNDYIYFPNLTIKDIIYCFRYGDINICGGCLNPSKYKDISIDDNLPKEEYFDTLYKQFKLKIKNPNELKRIEDNITKIELLLNNLDSINYNFNFDWLSKSIEELKGDSLNNPNRILIISNFKNILDLGNKIFDEEKIQAKALYASFEGN